MSGLNSFESKNDKIKLTKKLKTFTKNNFEFYSNIKSNSSNSVSSISSLLNLTSDFVRKTNSRESKIIFMSTKCLKIYFLKNLKI